MAVSIQVKMLKSYQAKALGKLFSSEVVSKAILFAGGLVLARLYSPEEFGALGVYSSILMVSATIGNLAFHRAVPVPKGDLTAALLVCASLLGTFAVGVALFVFGLIFQGFLAGSGSIWQERAIIFLLPLGLLSWSLVPVIQMALTRAEKFGALGFTKVSVACCLVALQVYFAGISLNVNGLILGDALARILVFACVVMIFQARLRRYLGRIKTHMIWGVIARYKRFPLLLAPTLLLQVVPLAAMPLIIDANLGTAQTGYWTQTVLYYNAMFAVSVALAPFFYQRWIAQMRETGRLPPQAWVKPMTVLCAVALPPALLFGLAGPAVFAVMLGETWRTSGEIASVLAFALFFQMIGGTYLLLLTLMEKETWNILVSIVWVICIAFIGLAAVELSLDIIDIAILYSTTTVGVYIVIIALSWIAIRGKAPIAGRKDKGD